MKSLRICIALLMMVTLSMVAGAPAAAQHTAMDPGPGVSELILAPMCTDGEIHDDGTQENGYGINPGFGRAAVVELFTPTGYPFDYTQACICYVSLGGPTLDYQVRFYDDDGAGGQPGTLLASIPAASVSDIPGGLPGMFYDTDVTGLVPQILDGGVYIGGSWDPNVFPSRFICSDETLANPAQTGFFSSDDGVTWTALGVGFPNYRSLFVRAEGAVFVPDVNVLEIPTLDTVGLGAMIVLLLGVSVFLLARRRGA